MFLPRSDSSFPHMHWSVLCCKLKVISTELQCVFYTLSVLSPENSVSFSLPELTAHLLNLGRLPGSPLSPLQPGSLSRQDNCRTTSSVSHLSRVIFLHCPMFDVLRTTLVYILFHLLVVPGKPYPIIQPGFKVNISHSLLKMLFPKQTWRWPPFSALLTLYLCLEHYFLPLLTSSTPTLQGRPR